MVQQCNEGSWSRFSRRRRERREKTSAWLDCHHLALHTESALWFSPSYEFRYTVDIPRSPFFPSIRQFPRRCKNSNYSQPGVMVLCTFFHGFGNNNNKEKKEEASCAKKRIRWKGMKKKKWGEKTNQQSPTNKQLPPDDMPCIYRAIGDIALTLFPKDS